MNERMHKINSLIEYILDNDLYTKHVINGIECDVYQKLEELFQDFRISNVNDRIAIAQKGYNYDLAYSFYLNIKLSDEEEKLLRKVRKEDEYYFETLNPEILSGRFSFIHDQLNIIYSDIDFQIELISLSDDELALFKRLYKKICNEVSYPINYLARILRCITINPFACLQSYSTYDGNYVSKKNKLFADMSKRFKKNIKVTEKELDLLLYFLINLDGFFVNKYEEMIKYPVNLKNSNVEHIVDVIKIKNERDENDLKRLKNAILMETYGISYGYANHLLTKYNLDMVEPDDFSSNYIMVYQSIKDIVCSNDSDALLQVYDLLCTNSEVHLDYANIVLFEQSLRKVFSREINKNIFRVEGKSFTLIDGVEVYDYDMESCLLITSVGAYKDKIEIEDYSEYWTSRKVRSHSNRCNLINSDNLAVPDIMNVVLGFTNFNNNMLLKSNVKRFNLNLSNRALNSIDDGDQVFMAPNNFVLSTRSQCNELIYERRELDNELTKYKKIPSYVIYFEELEENTKITSLELKEYLMDYKNIYSNSIRAAKEFGIPLVVVNREKCAKKGALKVKELLDDYLQNSNCNLIFDIFKIFEANRNGLGIHHEFLRKKYFSKDNMSEIVDDIFRHIKDVPLQDRDLHLKCLEYAVLREEKYLSNAIRDNIEPSFNKETIMDRIKTLREDIINEVI